MLLLSSLKMVEGLPTGDEIILWRKLVSYISLLNSHWYKYKTTLLFMEDGGGGRKPDFSVHSFVLNSTLSFKCKVWIISPCSIPLLYFRSQ